VDPSIESPVLEEESAVLDSYIGSKDSEDDDQVFEEINL
jgi:hypothetical protein